MPAFVPLNFLSCRCTWQKAQEALPILVTLMLLSHYCDLWAHITPQHSFTNAIHLVRHIPILASSSPLLPSPSAHPAAALPFYSPDLNVRGAAQIIFHPKARNTSQGIIPRQHEDCIRLSADTEARAFPKPNSRNCEE